MQAMTLIGSSISKRSDIAIQNNSQITGASHHHHSVSIATVQLNEQ